MNSLWKKWTINCALGELIGIGCAGIIAFLVNHQVGEPITIQSKCVVLISMMFAGIVEGWVLGIFQWKILKLKFKDLPQKKWLSATVAIATLGWFLGMLPSLFYIPEEISANPNNEITDFSNPWLFVSLSVLMGFVLGALFGLFQWYVLKKYALKAYKWIIANALGWGLGLGWIYLFASIPNENSSIAFIVLVGIIGGILAGLSVGIVTGYFLIDLECKTEELST